MLRKQSSVTTSPGLQLSCLEMHFLKVICVPELGLKVFQHLTPKDIENCRLVCKPLLHFIQTFLIHEPSVRSKLDQFYLPLAWMTQTNPDRISLNYEFDMRPHDWHEVRLISVVYDFIVLYLTISDKSSADWHTKSFGVLLFDNQGQPVDSFQVLAHPKHTVHTDHSIILIHGDDMPDEIIDLRSMEKSFIQDLEKEHVCLIKYFDDQINWVDRQSSQCTYHIRRLDPKCLSNEISRISITRPRDIWPGNVCLLSSSCFIIHYPDRSLIEAFDLISESLKFSIQKGIGEPMTLLHEFLNEFHLIVLYSREQLSELPADIYSLSNGHREDLPIEHLFRIQIPGRSCIRDQSTFHQLAMSESYIVATESIFETKSKELIITVVDLMSRTSRQFKRANFGVIWAIAICDERFLVATCCHSGQFLTKEGDIVVFDLEEQDEFRFWGSVNHLNIAKNGDGQQTITPVGDNAFVHPKSMSENALELLRFKPKKYLTP